MLNKTAVRTADGSPEATSANEMDVEALVALIILNAGTPAIGLVERSRHVEASGGFPD